MRRLYVVLDFFFLGGGGGLAISPDYYASTRMAPVKITKNYYITVKRNFFSHLITFLIVVI